MRKCLFEADGSDVAMVRMNVYAKYLSWKQSMTKLEYKLYTEVQHGYKNVMYMQKNSNIVIKYMAKTRLVFKRFPDIWVLQTSIHIQPLEQVDGCYGKDPNIYS